MKTRYILLVLLSFLIANIYAQDNDLKSGRKNRQNEKYEQTRQLIESLQFEFQAKNALPSRGGYVDLTTNRNYVRFTPELIDSYMPFFGRAYSIGFDDKGLRFKGKPEEFRLKNKGKKFEINASVNDQQGLFRIYMTVTPDGNASMTIMSTNREAMNYSGSIKPIGED